MAATREKAQLMSASEIERCLIRLAHEILEKTKDLDKLAFIGIRRRGVPLAQRLADRIRNLEKREIPVGIPMRPASDDTVMMRPHSRSHIPSTTARQPCRTP